MIVVYTAIFGNIDHLWTAETHGVKHIAFVDSYKQEHATANPVWEQVVVPPGWDNRRTARHFKTLPQYYMPEADVWVWMDCNVRLKISPKELVHSYLKHDFATFKHPDRDCLYDEATFCAKSGKDSADVLKEQTAIYEQRGMPVKWGLAETRIVIRRNNLFIRDLNLEWWEQIEGFSLRDQVSLPYIFWRRGARWQEIPGRCGPVRPSGPWSYQSHVK